MDLKLLARGAEAELTEHKYFGKNVVFKKRIRKKYRNLILDNQIRKERTKGEAHLLHKVKGFGVRVPLIYKIDPSEGLLVIEKIQGRVMKKNLNENNLEHMESAGEIAAKLHSAGIVHGDLTTSNLIITNSGIVIIDFGLGFESNKIEDFSVDLLNFKKTYKATHYNLPQGWERFVQAYKKNFSQGDEVIKRIAKIEGRARYS